MFKETKTTLGELWAEKIAAELGITLGLNMMHVQFAKKGNKYGVIMENFVPAGHELYDGGRLLLKTIPNFNVWSLKFYSIENIMNEIAYFGMEREFIKMCLFDTLIASQDRHCENWGILDDKQGTYSFSPIYDNGDSLGFNLPERKLIQHKTDRRAFEAFTNRTTTQIEVNGETKPKLKIMLKYFYDNYHNIMIEEIEKFRTIDYNNVLAIINAIPNEIMSSDQKYWVFDLIKYRHEWLIEYKWKEC